ncbi:MAG: hypothetical protein U0840_20635 [Gemmataceae bacterium]
MDRITLEQHFFASAPVGLVEGRGWKSVARSRGLLQHDDLEQHCVYYRPEQRSDLEPTTWGWYGLDDGRVVLHRIVYSGTDELRRPGNFLAHSLIAPADSLAAIDHDIVALLRWVELRSPQRYPIPGQSTHSGFCARHDQLYAQLGWEAGKLANLPPGEAARLADLDPLAVPLDEVRELRAELDRDFRDRIWTPLRIALGPATLDTLLLQAYLCPQEQRRPILLVGLGDDNSDDITAWNVASFLFALLPYHCRRRLTFSTYAGDQDGDRSMPHHWKRQLVITTGHNTVKMPSPGQASFPFWVINARTHKHLLPAAGSLSKLFVKLLAEGKWEALQRLREHGNRFNFGDEITGLEQLREMQEWSRGLDLHSFELFAEIAPCVRPGNPEFLKTCEKFLEAWTRLTGADTALFLGLAHGYLHAATTLYPPLQDGERRKVRDSLIQSFARLFQIAFQRNSPEVMSKILDIVSRTPALGDLREPILTRCFESLEAFLSKGLTLDHLDRFKGLWSMLRTCQTASRTGKRFVEQASAQFADLLLQMPSTERSRLHDALASFVIPVMLEAPFASPGQLGERLELLHDTAPDHPEVGGDFLMQLVRQRVVSPAQLPSLYASRPEYLIALQSEWRHACQEPLIHEVVGPDLTTPGILARFWSMPPEPVHHGVHRHVCEACRRLQPPECTALIRAYGDEGAARMIRALEPTDDAVTWASLQTLGETHAVILRTVEQAQGKESTKEERELLLKHLVYLILAMLMRPLRVQVSGTSLGAALQQPLEQIRQMLPTFEERRWFFGEVGVRCARWIEKGFTLDTARLEGLFEGLRQAQIDPVEAAWLTKVCSRIAKLTAKSSNAEREQAMTLVGIEMLEKYPHIARPTAAPSSVQREITESATVRQGLAELLLERCAPETGNKFRQEIVKWFDPGSEHRHCVDMLERTGVLKSIASRLAAQLDTCQSDAGLVAAQDLIRLQAPHSVREAVLPALREGIVAVLNRWKPQMDAVDDDRSELEPSALSLAVTLRYGVEAIASELAPKQLALYLRCVAFHVQDWPTERFREKNPEMVPMLHAVASALNVHLSEVWSRLFSKVAARGPRRVFCARFVAAGESLFRTPDHADALLEAARALAKLPAMESFEQLLQADNSQDPLYTILQDPPDDMGDLGTDQQMEVLVARAKFATVIYEAQRDGSESLASSLVGMATIPDSNRRVLQSRLALTLLGYLLLEGDDLSKVLHRGDQLCHPRFWKPFSKEVSAETAIKAFEELEKQLRKRGLDNAGSIVSRFQRKCGALGWLYSTSLWY